MKKIRARFLKWRIDRLRGKERGIRRSIDILILHLKKIDPDKGRVLAQGEGSRRRNYVAYFNSHFTSRCK